MTEDFKKPQALISIQRPISRADFQAPDKNGSDIPGPISDDSHTDDKCYRLAEVLAAVRRELEAVALIAEVGERDVPKFHLSSAEIDFAYGVDSLSDSGGLCVAFTQSELQNTPSEKLHHLKVTFSDIDVLSAESDTKVETKSRSQ